MTCETRFFRCEICGNLVGMIHSSGAPMTCCGQHMTELIPGSVDASHEKHVPVIEGNKVKVGSVPHPMTEQHYIEWIEIVGGNNVCRKFLKPGEAAEAVFAEFTQEMSREYCNVHGLWKAGK